MRAPGGSTPRSSPPRPSGRPAGPSGGWDRSRTASSRLTWPSARAFLGVLEQLDLEGEVRISSFLKPSNHGFFRPAAGGRGGGGRGVRAGTASRRRPRCLRLQSSNRSSSRGRVMLCGSSCPSPSSSASKPPPPWWLRRIRPSGARSKAALAPAGGVFQVLVASIGWPTPQSCRWWAKTRRSRSEPKVTL